MESSTLYYGPDRQYYRQDYSHPLGSETTHYVGKILEKVYDGASTDWRHYIRVSGRTVAIISRKSSGANSVHYQLEDHQGSGSVLVDSSGASFVRQSYAAYGLPRDGADWDGLMSSGDQASINGISRRGYTGHSMLGGMGLIHMNGRIHDSVTGRFLSPDPTIPNPGSTQSYNRYSYVNNNPLSYIDPSGFSDVTIFGRNMSYADASALYQTYGNYFGILCGSGQSAYCGELGAQLQEFGRSIDAFHLDFQIEQQVASAKAQFSPQGQSSGGFIRVQHSPEGAQLASQDMDRLVYAAWRAGHINGVRFDFFLEEPKEQGWALYAPGEFVYLGVRGERTGETNTASFAPPRPGYIAIIHTHPTWAFGYPGEGDYGHNVPIYGVHSTGVFVVRVGAAMGDYERVRRR